MLDRAGRGGGHGRRQAHGAVLWDHDAVNACGVSRPQDGTKVPWIFYPVQDQQKQRLPPIPGAIDDLIELDKRVRGRKRDDTLRRSSPRHAMDDLAGDLLNRDAALAG
jgi:hypothetical protein